PSDQLNGRRRRRVTFNVSEGDREWDLKRAVAVPFGNRTRVAFPRAASYRSTEITSMPDREQLMASEARGATRRPGLPTPPWHEPRRVRSRPTSAGGPPDPRPGPCTAPPFSPGPHGLGRTEIDVAGPFGPLPRRTPA